MPQGSILGPLLFLVYINDLPLNVSNSDTDIFADDTTIHAKAPSAHIVNDSLNQDLSVIKHWCDKNCMKLSTEKCKAMLIGSSYKLRTEKPHMNIKIDENPIQVSDNEKLLGVNIDSSLKWNYQVDTVLKKVNSLLYLLSRIKLFLPVETRKLFYNAYILPHLEYCCSVWGNCDVTVISQLVKFQKRAARVILDASYDTPSALLFQTLHWLPFQQRMELQKATLVYKSLNGLAPSYLNQKFRYTQNVHSLPLRSADKHILYLPRPRTELYKRSFSYSGAKLWNSIPQTIRNSQTVSSFKSQFSSYLQSNTT